MPCKAGVPVQRYFRDAKLYQIGEGTANIMRLLIADDALGIKKASRERLNAPSDFRGLQGSRQSRLITVRGVDFGQFISLDGIMRWSALRGARREGSKEL